MRVLQLIDSLRPGGAERMAVSYANALARRGQESFLCCTRMEGLLKKKLEPGVGYLFLEKKHTLDIQAYMGLRNFVKEHRIQIIQAHSSSYFLAVLVKWAVPGLKVVWHDHYGRELGERKDRILKWMSRYFDGIISVNAALKVWAQQHLKAGKVVYLKNFLPDPLSSFDRLRMTEGSFDKFGMTEGSFDKLRMPFDKLRMTEGDIELKGGHKTKIICVANLRPQKDHFNLVRAFELVLEKYPDVSLHLVGKEEGDSYSKELRSYILKQELQENIFFYGEQENVEQLIKQADVAVLSSESEGLPVALLEYGRAGVPVVCTRVGEIPEVIGAYGKLVPPKDPKAFATGILFYLGQKEEREEEAGAFQKKVMQEFSEEAVMPEVIEFMEHIITTTK